MPLAPSIVQASDAVRAEFLPKPPAQARLPWTGFKANNAKAFFESIYTSVKPHTGDYYATATTIDNLDYGGWFNYFFREAKASIVGNAAAEESFGRVFSVVFDLAVDGQGNGAKLKPAAALPAAPKQSFVDLLARDPAGIPKAVLTYLFELGFREADQASAGDYFARTLALKSNMPEGVAIRSSKGEFVFGYRGDTRDPATVQQHKGAKCRAGLDFWRRDANVDALWHPWAGQAGAWTKMWYRMGAKDNDYFTLNSMAKDFHISCAYPMFRSFEIDQRLVGPVSGWDQQKRSLLAGSKARIVNAFNKKTNAMEEVLSDEGRVYICTVTSDTTVTKTWELNGYPESGIRNVGLEDMLAWVRIRRYHFPPDSAHDHYDSTRVRPAMTIKVFSWGWVRSEDEARATLGCTVEGMKVLSAKLNNLIGKLFDISHTEYFATHTYDPDRTAAPVLQVVPVKKPVRLSTR